MSTLRVPRVKTRGDVVWVVFCVVVCEGEVKCVRPQRSEIAAAEEFLPRLAHVHPQRITAGRNRPRALPG